MRYLIAALFLFTVVSLQAQVPNASILTQKAPIRFKALFTTTRGSFTIEAYRDWSPQGVDRLYQLIKTGFYNDVILFRVQPDYVVQFGIADNRQVNRFWDSRKLSDEPVLQSNGKGIISFARGGANDRTTQLFINMADNRKLDTALRNGLRGYTPIARVINGMETVSRFYAAYGRATLAHQDSVYLHGNRYLYQHFPGLDKIIRATILD